jgi:hypothetical protein
MRHPACCCCCCCCCCCSCSSCSSSSQGGQRRRTGTPLTPASAEVRSIQLRSGSSLRLSFSAPANMPPVNATGSLTASRRMGSSMPSASCSISLAERASWWLGRAGDRCNRGPAARRARGAECRMLWWWWVRHCIVDVEARAGGAVVVVVPVAIRVARCTTAGSPRGAGLASPRCTP